MSTITLNLPKEVEQELEKDLQQLETITKKPKVFHVEKAVIRYELRSYLLTLKFGKFQELLTGEVSDHRPVNHKGREE